MAFNRDSEGNPVGLASHHAPCHPTSPADLSG